MTSLVSDHGVDAREHVDAFKKHDEDVEEEVVDLSKLPRARVWVRFRLPEQLGCVRPGWRFESASG